MRECDKRNSHISSKLHMVCISSNNDGHPVTKTLIQNITISQNTTKIIVLCCTICFATTCFGPFF